MLLLLAKSGYVPDLTSNMVDGRNNYGYKHTAFSDPVKCDQFDCAMSSSYHDAPFANSSSRNHYVLPLLISPFVTPSLWVRGPLLSLSTLRPLGSFWLPGPPKDAKAGQRDPK